MIPSVESMEDPDHKNWDEMLKSWTTVHMSFQEHSAHVKLLTQQDMEYPVVYPKQQQKERDKRFSMSENLRLESSLRNFYQDSFKEITKMSQQKHWTQD